MRARFLSLLLVLSACAGGGGGGSAAKQACLNKIEAANACNEAAGNPVDTDPAAAELACKDPFSADVEQCLADSYIGGNCISPYDTPINDKQTACYQM